MWCLGRSHSDWQTSTTIAKAPNACFISLLVSVSSGGTAVHLGSFINDTSKSVGKNMHFFVFCCCPLYSFGLNLRLREVEPNSVSRYFVSRLQKSPYFCVLFSIHVHCTQEQLLRCSYSPLNQFWEKNPPVLQSISLVQMSIGHRENGSVLLHHLPCEQRHYDLPR